MAHALRKPRPWGVWLHAMAMAMTMAMTNTVPKHTFLVSYTLWAHHIRAPLAKGGLVAQRHMLGTARAQVSA